MRIASPIHAKKARIEIIPLIDIMFFLLASFMMVSLTMIRMQSIKMDLPTATAVSTKVDASLLNIDVDKTGQASISNTMMNTLELYGYLTNAVAKRTNLSIYIKGNNEATHGAIISILDTVKRSGAPKVSFAINPPKPPQ